MQFSKGNLKASIAEKHWLKYVPNALTLCNSLCGFAAILWTIRAFLYAEYYDASALFTSAWIILFAMIFDALDGFAARIFNAASMHGMQMDSLADMVTFGVAPAVIIAVMAHAIKDATGTFDIYVYVMSCIYMGCAALRLATYNVHAILNKKSSDKFSGLPSPGAAAGICSVLLLFNTAELYEHFSVPLALFLPLYAAILGLLMVSNFQYLHAAKWFFAANPAKRNFIIMIGLFLIAFFRIPAIAVMINLYIFSAPAAALYGWLRGTKKKFPPQTAD